MNIRKLAAVIFTGLVFSLPTLATAGYVGPDAVPVSTVKELLDRGIDDQVATLKGKITKKIGTDHYKFEDVTGTMNVEIDAHHFPPSTPVDDTTLLEITGELDREMLGRTTFDVKQLRLLP